MKIYFAGSIRGGRDDKELYFSIIKELSAFGTVLTEHVGGEALTAYGETALSDKEIFNRDMDWMRESDVIVAEVTTPSLGVGYEIGQAESIGKRILCLFREEPSRRVSAMIAGNGKLDIRKYESIEDAKKILSEYFS